MPFAQKLRYGLEAAVFFAAMGLFRILGVDAASALGGLFGRQVLYRTSISNRARSNLCAAYPDKGEEEIENITVEMWDNLGRTIAEYAHLDKFNFRGADARIEVANMDTAVRKIEQGKGILFVSGHFANWRSCRLRQPSMVWKALLFIGPSIILMSIAGW